MDKKMESVFNILPDKVNKALYPFYESLIEEIRIKVNCPVFIYKKNKEHTLYYNNEIYIVKKEDVDYILKKATKNSLYAYMEDIKNGFITIDNGHRIGISGRAVYENGKLINIKDINSLNIRCANELKGVYKEVYNKLFLNKDIENTLIISPPKCGKTTLLRDLTRFLSNNKNIKIALIDERDEIASSYMGKDYNDVGERTFVLSGYSKEEGFSHAVRSLSPDIIICDEIGDKKDFDIISYALLRGVKIIATLHGEGILKIKDENKFNDFKNIIVLNKNFEFKLYKFTDGECIEL